MQVRLCPEPDFHPFLTGVIAQRLQVLDIAFQGLGLSVSGSVTVVRKNPAQRHVMRLVTVDDGTGRELVVVLLAVQRFLDSSVVLLAFHVFLTVLEKNTFLRIFLPIVTVVCVEVPFVETELRQQDRMARQLVEAVEQGNRRVVQPEETIQVRSIVS